MTQGPLAVLEGKDTHEMLVVGLTGKNATAHPFSSFLVVDRNTVLNLPSLSLAELRVCGFGFLLGMNWGRFYTCEMKNIFNISDFLDDVS